MSNAHKSYRVYAFDGIHKVLDVNFIKAASDAEAIAKATAEGFGTKCEIWGGRRMVAQLEGERKAG